MPRSCVRTAMHLIRLYGLRDDGSCTCAKGAACHSAGKHPRDSAWQTGEPLTDAELAAWLGRGGNVGWRMGEQPDGTRLVCLDEDECGALDRACAELGALPATLTAETGSGGIHAIYAWPAGVDLPRNSVRVRDGIDVRSEGGQIAVEPSRHKSGRQYRWVDVRDPAPMPAAWVTALATPRSPVRAPAPAKRSWPVEAVAALVAAELPPAGVPGGRHEIVRALGGWLRRRGWDLDSITAVVRQLPSDNVDERVHQARIAALEAAEAPGTMGWDVLSRRLGSAEHLERLARDPREPADWVITGCCWSEWWARWLPRWDAKLQARRTSALPKCVTQERRVWLLQDDGTYGPEHGLPILPSTLRIEMTRLGWDVRDDDGKRVPVDLLLEQGGVAYKREYSFTARGLQYDANRKVLTHGCLLPTFEPQWDADVAAWFQALFGQGLDAAHQWIASCAPQHNGELSACLVLIGERGTGKSALAVALARMWGAERDPVRLADVCARFNARAVESPIVLDDECAYLQHGEMTSQDFLERIQAFSRKVEYKGQEKIDLLGTQRVIVTANDSGSLRFRKIRGSASVEASAARMAWHASINVQAARAALKRLQLPGTVRIDMDRVCRHIAWLWQTVQLQAQRFAGAWGADAAAAEIEAELEDQAAPLYDALRRAKAGESWGKAIIAEGDQLLVHVPSLLSALQIEGSRVDQTKLQQQLRSFRRGRPLIKRRLEGVATPRDLWPVDMGDV